MRRLACLFFLFTFSFLLTNAQQFGGNPASLKWRQINTDTARIIFPAGLDSSAERVAAIIHELQRNHNTTIGKTLRKVNIVLQNQTTVTNGYVSLAPFRSEFYLFAPQDNFRLGTLGWADNLSLHEYRHVQQNSNFNVGLSKVVSYIFGQEGQAIANGLAIPDWFFEGDAVFNETSLSTNGRGRLPFFFKNYQSLFYGDKHYSYMKLRNGSLRHFVPDHYDLGYLLVAYGREKYGPDIWRKITQDAAAYKTLIYPFQGAFKQNTGVAYQQFVQDAFHFYQNQWKEEKVPDVQWLTAAHNNYVVNYRYPYATRDGRIVALKYGYRQIPVFVLVDSTGKEEKIAVRDITNEDYFSYNNGKIVYAGLKPDARWGYRQFSNITLLDVATRKRTVIARHTRYFSPDISHSGSKLVAIEMTTDQRSNLVLLDITGKVLLTYKSGGGTTFTYPKFSADDKAVYVMAKNAAGQMALQKWNPDGSNSLQTALPFAKRIIGFPVVQGATVFFSASNKGQDEIWAYSENSRDTCYRIAGYPTGYYGGTMDGDHLVASAFTANGYRLARLPQQQVQWQKQNFRENTLPDLYAVAALQQFDSATLSKVPDRQFATTRYNKLTNPFNFHSWRPYIDEPEYSFTLYGQNILNTLRTEIGYTWNRNENSHRLGANLVYGATYVQPFAGISQTWNRTIRYNADTSFHYNELNANIGLQLPLNLSGGRMYRYLTPSISFNNQQVQYTGILKGRVPNTSFNFLQARLVYSGQIQQAAQHIYPRWAQTLVVQYRSAINKYTARQFLASGYLYLPGLLNNHNLVLSAAYQARDTANQYYYSNSFPFSRSYNAIDFPRMWRLGANYHFPLAYPDWGFGNLVYFRRIRANAFYDYTIGKSLRTKITYPFSTAGLEVFFDTRWWNQQNVSFGFRYSHLLDKELRGATQPNQFEIILPVGLFDY